MLKCCVPATTEGVLVDCAPVAADVRDEQLLLFMLLFPALPGRCVGCAMFAAQPDLLRLLMLMLLPVLVLG